MSALKRTLSTHSPFSLSETVSNFLKVRPKLNVFEHIRMVTHTEPIQVPIDAVRKRRAALLKWLSPNGQDVVSGGQHLLYSGSFSAEIIAHAWKIVSRTLWLTWMPFNTTSKASMDPFNGVPATGIAPATGEMKVRAGRMKLLARCMNDFSLWPRLEKRRTDMTFPVIMWSIVKEGVCVREQEQQSDGIDSYKPLQVHAHTQPLFHREKASEEQGHLALERLGNVGRWPVKRHLK